MKKLMIGAAVVALAAGAFASCSDSTGKCVAWDFSMSLKSLDAKKLSCKDACGDKSSLYYLDNATRKLKGFLWACNYDCDEADELNVVLWDTKKKIPVLPAPLPASGDDFIKVPVTFDDWLIYGKKGNKVATPAGEAPFVVGGEGYDINVTLAGLNGTLKTGCSDCYIKSISGQAAGQIAISVNGEIEYEISGGLCGDSVVTVCGEDDAAVYYLSLCAVCCGFDGWCTEISEENIKDLADDDFMVPAYGSWKMKYNKKMSLTTTKTIYDYIPGYAL